MTFWSVVSKLTRESERDLKRRFSRARLLIKGMENPKEFLDDRDLTISGKIFLVTTWRTGKGEEDFLHILRRKHYKVTKIIRLNWLKYSERALVHGLSSNSSQFSTGDIVAIVRGGGDTKDRQFAQFNEPAAVEAIRSLKEHNKVVVVTGVGHSSDHFAIEEEATFNQATPTDAAYLICELLDD